MKRLTALILAFATVFTVLTANANAVDIHDAVISETANGIPLENELILHFRKTFRTLLNDFFARANADFLIMATDIKLDMENIAVEVGTKAYLNAKVDPKGAKNKKNRVHKKIICPKFLLYVLLFFNFIIYLKCISM